MPIRTGARVYQRAARRPRSLARRAAHRRRDDPLGIHRHHQDARRSVRQAASARIPRHHDAGARRRAASPTAICAPRNAEQLALKRRNIEFWAEQTFGQMGRYPEFCRRAGRRSARLDPCDRKDQQAMGGKRPRLLSFTCSRNDLCLTHALTDQYYDRTKRVSEQEDPDLILHIVGETNAGPVVRGLRTLATLAPISDEVLVYPNRPRDPDEAGLCDRLRDSDEHARLENPLPRSLRRARRSRAPSLDHALR